MYEVSRLIWYIICVVIIINKEIVEVNVLKSHTLKISAKINYVKPKNYVAKGLIQCILDYITRVLPQEQ